jgi:hypothetical protein
MAALAVLALAAMGAASASAAQWYVGGKALTGSEKLATTIKAEENTVLSFYYNASEKTPYLQVTCTSLNGTKLEAITAPATLKGAFGLGGCKVTKPTEKSCELENGESLWTDPLEAKLALGAISPEDAAEFSAVNARKQWMEVNLREDGCASLIGIAPGNEWEIRGKLTVKVPTGQQESTEQELVFEHAEGLYSFNTGQPVSITGKLKLKLASGKAWSFH